MSRTRRARHAARSSRRVSAMAVTPEQIEAEHNAALASLTDSQRRAIQRMRQAKQHAVFNGKKPTENLLAIFEAEAQALSPQPAALALARGVGPRDLRI